MEARLHLGAQGWLYQDWIGPFYPPGVSGRDMLGLYARVFSTVEVDSTYYATPPERTVEGWRRRTPDAFRFALKTPSEVTHERRLRDAETPFARFVERARLLGPKLGAILVQMPPDFGADAGDKAALARFMRNRATGDLRVALELRDPRLFDDDLFALARDAEFSIAVTEGTYSDIGFASDVARELCREPPAAFAYLRWLGDRSLTRFDRVQRDASASLDAWARLLRPLRASVRDIYGYANNHYQGHSPATVRAVLARLGEPVPPETAAPRLF